MTAVHLWAQLRSNVADTRMWHAFIDAIAHRPITPADFDAVAVVLPVRQLWLMGICRGRRMGNGIDTGLVCRKIPRTWEAKTVAQSVGLVNGR